jgi:hypothetical protein
MAERDEQDEGAVEYGSNSVGFDEMEAARNAPEAPDLSKITLDGDDVPETVRGKSVSDLVARLDGALKALQISEQARLALANSQEALTAARSGSAPAAPPPPVPDPELNEEQLQALYDESPRKYQDYMAEKTEKRVLSVIQRTIAPLAGNSADMTLRDARVRYADEFAAFGPEIQSFISAMPDKSVLAAPGQVDELMDWMRGKHWKKFQDHLANKTNGALDDARDSMRRETPPDFARTPQANKNGGRRGAVQLDQTQKEVAAAMGLSEDEYAQGLTPTRGRRG